MKKTTNLVRLENVFALEAQYKLTIAQQKLFYALIAKLEPKNSDTFEEIELDFIEIKNILAEESTAYKSLYTISKEITKRLIKASFSFPTEVLEHGQHLEGHTTFFSSIIPKQNKMGKLVISFCFNKKLIPYLLALNEYVKISNSLIAKMKSSYSIRIYTILKTIRAKQGKYEKVSCKTLAVDKLQRILGLEKSYSRFYDFEKYVLKKSQKEINEQTDIQLIDIKKLKKNRKIVELMFVFTDKATFNGLGESMLYQTNNGIEQKQNNWRSNAKPSATELKKLTYTQYNVFTTLKDYAVNTRFIMTTILPDIANMGDEMKGYEDIYIKMALEQFEQRVKATSTAAKAGILVKWWKNKQNFTDNLSVAKYREQLNNYKKRLRQTNQRGFNMRKLIRNKPHLEATKMLKELQKQTPLQAFNKSKLSSQNKIETPQKSLYNDALFAELFPEKLAIITKEISHFYKEHLIGVDKAIIEVSIKKRIRHECQKYYNSLT